VTERLAIDHHDGMGGGLGDCLSGKELGIGVGLNSQDKLSVWR
jgi:hypothetical protein